MMKKQLIPLAGFINEIEAQVAAGHLESEGVSTSLVKDDAGGMLPSLQETESVTLLIKPSDLKRGKAILAERSGAKRSKRAVKRNR